MIFCCYPWIMTAAAQLLQNTLPYSGSPFSSSLVRPRKGKTKRSEKRKKDRHRSPPMATGTLPPIQSLSGGTIATTCPISVSRRGNGVALASFTLERFPGHGLFRLSSAASTPRIRHGGNVSSSPSLGCTTTTRRLLCFAKFGGEEG